MPGGANAISFSGRTSSSSVGINSLLLIGFSFVATPLLAVLLRGVNPSLLRVLGDPALWRATALTAGVGIASAVIAVLLATGLLLSARHLQLRKGYAGLGKIVASLGLVALVVPATVMSAGLFLLLREYIDVFAHALWLIVAVNALLGLPFACAVLSDPLHNTAKRCDRLCASLGVLGLNRWRWVEWPLLKKPVGLALGLCSALAAGDLTAIALFGSQNLSTLPLLLYQRIGSYRMDEASATALLLLLMCLALFLLFDRAFRGSKNATA